MLIDLECSWCKIGFKIKSAEYNRCIKRGQKSFFCCRSCNAKKREIEQPDKRVEIEKICPYCKKPFKTMTGAKSSTFCSRSCASAGSMNEERRLGQSSGGKLTSENFISVEESLKLRESWKYVKIKEFLEFQNEEFEFEYRIGCFVYDLALLKRKILIEFDGKYHKSASIVEKDKEKEKFAIENGWLIKRKPTLNNTVIEPNLLYGILE